MTSISNAVEQRKSDPTAMITQYTPDFATMLPSHIKPEQWARVAVGALRRDPNLMQAARNDPARLMSELAKAARLGLEPGTEEFYLTCRKEKGTNKVLGITGYQGMIELMYRAGAVGSVVAEVVYTGDRFDYVPGRDSRPIHTIDWDADDRGKLRLVYAYAVMKDGATSKVIVLRRSDIERIKESSQGSDSKYSPWQTNEPAMWLKSAVRQLAKWVPTSAEYRREQLRAAQDVAAERSHAPAEVFTQQIDLQPGEHIDELTGEIVEGGYAEADIVPDEESES